MRLRHCIAAIAIVLLARVPSLRGQDTAAAAAPGVPCRDVPCRLLFDWGGGNTAANYPNDRRYGLAADFEPLLRTVLQNHQFRIVEAGDAMTMSFRPVMKNAMCDAMPGTNTDMSCRTVDEVQVQFINTPQGVKGPGTIRVTNRCGADDQRMNITQMATYTGNMIAYQMATDRKGLKRPTAKC